MIYCRAYGFPYELERQCAMKEGFNVKSGKGLKVSAAPEEKPVLRAEAEAEEGSVFRSF